MDSSTPTKTPKTTDPPTTPLLLGSGNGWAKSIDHPLLTASTSNPSLSTRIFPHQAQLGGTVILSRSMTLCFRGCRLSSDVMPRLACMRLCSCEGKFGVVYISEAPSGGESSHC